MEDQVCNYDGQKNAKAYAQTKSRSLKHTISRAYKSIDFIQESSIWLQHLQKNKYIYACLYFIPWTFMAHK